MPFVRKTDSQGSQPPTDTRKLFIGRTGELLFFVQNILKPEEPTHNIISIWGQGGVGKSTLLARFIDDARSAEYKDYCLTATVDEQQTTPASIMEKFATQLHMQRAFQKALKHYKEALRTQQTEREMMQDTLVHRMPIFAGAAVEGVPFAGPLLGEGVKATAEHLLDRRNNLQRNRDAELLEDPVNELTRVFVDELNQLVETQVPLGSQRVKKRRVILFFDTFEHLAIEAVPWLLNYFLQADIKSNIVLVIAGRDSIEHSIPVDTKRWLPFCENETIYWIPLNNFTEDETRAYLIKRNITDPERIATIWQLSQGLPLYLSLLTSNPRGKVDPAADVIANFLRWIPEQEQIKRQLALDASLFSRPFNQDDLAAFAYLPEKELPSLYHWLVSQPFVRSQEGRYHYHEVVQELFSRHFYQRSKKEYYATRRAVANHYQHVLEELQQQGDKERDDTDESLELMLALTYQLLLLPDEASHIKALEYALRADRHLKHRGELVKMLRELSQEQPTHWATFSAIRTVGQLLHYIDPGSQDPNVILVAIDYLLEKVAQAPSFSPELLAILYRRRGRLYASRREQMEAISNYNRALELDPKLTGTYIQRGNAYRWLGEYQKAIKDFDYVLELNPKNALAYAERAVAYLEQAEYERALEDCNRALELDPKNGWAYICRSMVYRDLGDYQRAIEDCNRALELDPRQASRAYFQRGQNFLELKDYQRAIQDFDQGIEQDSSYDRNYIGRARAYEELKDYQQAIQNFDRAIEIAPRNAWAYNRRAFLSLRVHNTQQARVDYLRSWELETRNVNAAWMAQWCGICLERNDSRTAESLEKIAAIDPQNYIAYVCRGVAWFLQKSFEQSLKELEQAILLEPEEWDAYFWKGMVCAALRRDEDAKAAVEKSLEVNMPPVLLAPLRWFEQDRPDFYQKYVVPLMARYDLV